MRHPLLAVASFLVVAGGCSGSNVSVTNVTSDGNVLVDSTSPNQPPVGAIVSRDGVQALPTPPPVGPEPEYPITPPAPTKTPRP